MVVIPDSEITLLKSPLKLDNNNQLTFANATAQYNYFNSLPKLTHSSFSYIRKEGVVRIPTHKEDGDGLPTYEDLLEYNYCMYKNTHYKEKWFYAYITDVIYQNDGMSTIAIETDVFQTWQFDIVYKNSFIEREHVADDTIGLHTVPESIEHGPYIINDYSEFGGFEVATSKPVIATTWVPSNTPGIMEAIVHGGVTSGLYFMIFKTNTDAQNYICAMDGFGRGDSIVSIFMVPSFLVTVGTWYTATLHSKANNNSGGTDNHDYTIEFALLQNTFGSVNLSGDKTATLPTTLNGYTPKNNKLFCYPYNYLLVTNNNGANAEFHYEEFTGNAPQFRITGVASPGCSIKCFPLNYKSFTPSIVSLHAGFNEGIMAGKFPVGSYKNDSFVNWMTQNSVNVMMAKVGAVARIGGMLFQGGGGDDSQYGGLFEQQARYVSERYQHALVAPQASGNINGGDVTFGFDEMNFGFYKMSIKAEYASIIDNHFSQFGYQVNRLATPNINKRTYWDYMKTFGVNLEGAIPENDLAKLRRLFDSGCTFWHNPTYFLDYSQNNAIVS